MMRKVIVHAAIAVLLLLGHDASSFGVHRPQQHFPRFCAGSFAPLYMVKEGSMAKAKDAKKKNEDAIKKQKQAIGENSEAATANKHELISHLATAKSQDVKGGSKKEDGEMKKIGEKIDEYANNETLLLDPQRTFKVSVSMARTGERKIGRILFSNRAPTRSAKSQGQHIVAVGLFQRAVENYLEGAPSYRFEKNEKGEKVEIQDEGEKKNTISGKLEKIANFDDKTHRQTLTENKKSVTYETDVEDQIETLKEFTSYEANLQNLKDQDEIRNKTRQVLVVRSRLIARIIESITRIWNKRPYAVYYLKKKRNAKVDDVDFKKAQIEFQEFYQYQATGEGPVLATLKVYNDKQVNESELIHAELRKLVDLKGEQAIDDEEKKLRTKLIGEQGKFTTEIGTYNDILDSSVKEAVRLAKLAFPNLEFTEEELKDAIKRVPLPNTEEEKKPKK